MNSAAKPLEAIWPDLSKDSFESQAWHGQALQETQQLVKTGKGKFSDWDEARARLHRKTGKVA